MTSLTGNDPEFYYVNLAMSITLKCNFRFVYAKKFKELYHCILEIHARLYCDDI